MKINLHKNAKTTPAQRRFIQSETQMNTSDLALKIGVSETTVRRWKNRSFVFDKPNTPKKIITALTPFEELMVVLIRLCLRTGLDDLQHIVHTWIQASCSRSSLNRCLKRYNISRLPSIQTGPMNHLNDYRGTFLYHTKIILPVLPGASEPLCIQTLLDTSFRWVYAEISVSDKHFWLNFIKTSIHQFPLTVLGIIFSDTIDFLDTDSFFSESNRQHGQLIEKFCNVHELGSYYLKSDISPTIDKLRQTLNGLQNQHPLALKTQFQLNHAELIKKVFMYNTQLCQRSLKQKTPQQALKNHYINFPGSFKKCSTQLTGTPHELHCFIK